ncbi:MAG: AMP-binding protein [Streptosporangiaceae bacterium]
MSTPDRPWLTSYPDSLRNRPAGDPAEMLTAFRATVARHPDRPAVHYFGTTTTWRELDSQSDALASALAHIGVTRGDRVAVYLQNVPPFLVTVLATWKIGGAVVPVNPMNRQRELAFQLGDSGACVLVCLRSGYPIAADVLADHTEIRVIAVDDRLGSDREDDRIFPNERTEVPEGILDYADLIRDYGGQAWDTTQVSPREPAFLTYTSGTTGPPKAAVNTHGQVMWATACWRDLTTATSDDVFLGMPPLFHVTGLVAMMTLSFLTGAALVLAYRFEPTVMLELLREHEATVTTGAITAFVALSNVATSKEEFRSLRAVLTGGAPVAPAVAERFERITGQQLHPGYGLTETASASHSTPLGRRSPVDPGTGALSVGVPLPGIDAVILDDGRELPPGEVGEIALAGPSVTEEYWHNPAETSHAIPDGRLRTGDIGFMDASGWFYVVDRKKDQINVSGYKVWPREVEDVLYEHEDVREVAVVGAPDQYRGETVVAFVSLRVGATVTPEDLIAFAKERMAAYKYPRRVQILDELPKTVSGKILRREVREPRNLDPGLSES